MIDSSFKNKFIQLPFGYRKSLSPMFITGNLIASGLSVEKAGIIATYIIGDIPDEGISEDGFLDLFLSYLPEKGRWRFLTLDLMKKYLVSPRSKSPLFMFLGGFTGKTFLTSYVQQHLGINRVTALDDDKYAIRERNPERSHLFKSTYEEWDTYEKTLEDFYPVIRQRIEQNMAEYRDKKKWTYFWEGIYFTAGLTKRLQEELPHTDIMSVFLLPPFEQIKERYVIRWMSELGRRFVEENREKIDGYIRNVEHIREVIVHGVEQTDCVVIEAAYFDDVLATFYESLHARLLSIATREGIQEWIDKVMSDRKYIHDYEYFLEFS